MAISYSFPCILLSGMPCTGKDTLTQKLTEYDPTFVFFKKHRTAISSSLPENDHTYINIEPEDFRTLIDNGGFLQFHARYGKMYGVAKAEYTALVRDQKIPIIHVGKYENLLALRQSGLQDACSILLWADRTIVKSRLEERHKNRLDGVEERLVAYDQEVEQLKQYALKGKLDFDLLYENTGNDAAVAAKEFLQLLSALSPQFRLDAQTSLSRLLHLCEA